MIVLRPNLVGGVGSGQRTGAGGRRGRHDQVEVHVVSEPAGECFREPARTRDLSTAEPINASHGVDTNRIVES